MAIVTLSDEQRIAVEGNPRFQSLVRMAINNKAAYWRGLNGSSVPGNDYVRWAKSRLLSYSIISNPGGVDFPGWLKQFVILLKDHQVYDDSVPYNDNVIIDYMILNNIFDAIVDAVFDLQILNIAL